MKLIFAITDASCILPKEFKGAKFSTHKQVLINRIDKHTLLVAYAEDELIRCDRNVCVNTILSQLESAYTNCNIMFAIYTTCSTDDGFEMGTFVAINELSMILDGLNTGILPTGVKSNFYRYSPDEEVMGAIRHVLAISYGTTDPDEFDFDDGYVNDGYVDDDDYPDFARLPDPIDVSGKKNKGKKSGKTSKKKKKFFVDGTSYALMASKSPKKEYERHGVIVVKNKKPIEKDARLIMSMLKRFIPGKQSWKKQFRKDLAERWLGSYVVTKKKLTRLEKEYRQKQREKKRVEHRPPIFDPAKALIMTESILANNRTDSWSDPKR